LLERGRAIAIDIPTAAGRTDQRVILTENYGRYVAAFGADAVASVFTGGTLSRHAGDTVPESSPARGAEASRAAGRSSASSRSARPVSDILARDFDRAWVKGGSTMDARRRLVRPRSGRQHYHALVLAPAARAGAPARARAGAQANRSRRPRPLLAFRATMAASRSGDATRRR
jgi:hypothetical protein